MRAEDLSQGGVDQMRRGVVALDVTAAGLVHLREHGRGLELLPERAHDRSRAVRLLDVGHVQLPPFPPYSAGIADLPAGLGVERILLQHHLDAVARLAELEDVGLGPGGLIADPLLRALGLHDAPLAAALGMHGGADGSGALGDRRYDTLAPPADSRALALFLERTFEPRDVHRSEEHTSE